MRGVVGGAERRAPGLLTRTHHALGRSSRFGKILLADCRTYGVLGIDEVAKAYLAALAERHVCIPLVESVVLGHPEHELAIRDARRVLQRARTADRHDHLFVLE